MSQAAPEAVAAVRRFNRFYTRQVGALGRLHLNGPYALTEVRVLYELAHHEGLTAKALGAELGLDAGYLSRMLKRFETDGLIRRAPLPGDGRSALLQMTDKGRSVFASLDERTRREVTDMLERLGQDRAARLTGAMADIERLLDPEPKPGGDVILRTHRVGDMGWIVWRHGVLYAREYGWDERFEALVARICADFLEHHDPGRERCWIAERDGERLGCIALVATDRPEGAKLRILLVEPAARGLGVGRRLVEACVSFARQAGYREIVLMTESSLTAARAIYAKAGFELEGEDPQGAFAPGVTAETWRLKLG